MCQGHLRVQNNKKEAIRLVFSIAAPGSQDVSLSVPRGCGSPLRPPLRLRPAVPVFQPCFRGRGSSKAPFRWPPGTSAHSQPRAGRWRGVQRTAACVSGAGAGGQSTPRWVRGDYRRRAGHALRKGCVRAARGTVTILADLPALQRAPQPPRRGHRYHIS